jgi:hypothetical protein
VVARRVEAHEIIIIIIIIGKTSSSQHQNDESFVDFQLRSVKFVRSERIGFAGEAPTTVRNKGRRKRRRRIIRRHSGSLRFSRQVWIIIIIARGIKMPLF